MAGTTAHELNQPLMVLLGNLELIEMSRGDEEKRAKCLSIIKESGKRIAEIVKKIQTIQHVEVKPYLDGPGIIDLDRKRGE